MNKYTNSKGKNKQSARKIMVNAIAESRTSKGTILSLPFETWAIEQMICFKVSRKFTFLGCEMVKTTYQKMVANALDNPLLDESSFHFGKLGEVITNVKENTYSHIIADYCGQLHKVAGELGYALKNRVVEKDGTIAITLNERISGDGIRFEKNIVKGFGKRKKGITRCQFALECFVKKNAGDNFKIETVYKYNDKKDDVKGAAMILMIVRRIK